MWWWWLILGLLIGWLIEWVIDWIYWRPRYARVVAELENARAERDKFSGELKTLRASYDGVLAERDALNKELAALRARMAELDGEVATLRGNYDSILGERDGLSRDLLAQRAQFQELNGELTNLRGSYNGVLTERDGVSQELAALRARSQELDGDLVTLRGSYDGLLRERDSAQGELASLRGTYDAILGERDSLHSELGDLRGRYDETQVKLAAFQDDSAALAAARAEIERLRAELAALQPLESQAAESSGTLQRVRTRLAGLAGVLGFTAGRATATDGDVDEMLDLNIDAMQEKLNSSAAENAELRAQLDAANARLASTRERYATALGIGMFGDSSDATDTTEADELDEVLIQEITSLRANVAAADSTVDLGSAGLVAGAAASGATLIGSYDHDGDATSSALVSELGASGADVTLGGVARDAHDPLIDIDGIGPVYEQRLNAAGITTFEALINTPPERLRAIVGAEDWQDVDPESWIIQARYMIGNANFAPRVGDPIIAIDGIGPIYDERLRAAGITTFAQIIDTPPDRLREIVGATSADQADAESWIAQARLMGSGTSTLLGSSDAAAGRVLPDPLIDIDGIGPVYARRLNEAGIFTFEQLIQTPPEQLRTIVSAESWQDVDAESWIIQARYMLGNVNFAPRIGDALIDIDGIGPVYDQRLRAAGITTFAELIATDDERIREIVRARSWQVLDLASWKEQARTMMSGQGGE